VNGIVVYDGPSHWDGGSIIVVVTGLWNRSNNPKTGDMLQTWILMKDVHPHEAVISGLDESICGHCPHRRDEAGHRSCYVSMNAPGQIWKAYHRGRYKYIDPEAAGYAVAGRKIRIGAYGDPAMVPLDVWTNLISQSPLTTGYTHQWRTMSPKYAEFCMASVDSAEEAAEAKALGYRTFRCITKDESLLSGELICPASEEAGKLAKCEDCGLCSGSMSSRSNVIPTIAITVHGVGSKYFIGNRRVCELGKEARHDTGPLE